VTALSTAVDRNVGNGLVAAAGLILAVAVVMPIGMVLFGAIRSDSPGMPGATYTLAHLAQIYATTFAWVPLRNTLLTCVPGTLIALSVGLLLAWLMQRTDAPGHRWLEPFLLAPIYFSPLSLALGWVLLGAPKIGLINLLWPGPGSIVNVYTWSGIIFFIGLYFTPYVYLIVAGALRSLDAGYEDAGSVLGARPLRAFVTITLPMLRPQILASALLVFVISVSMFAEQLMFGARFQFTNLPIEMYSQIVSSPANYNLAAALGTLMLLIACAGLYFYRLALARGERFVTTQSRGFVIRRIPLGRARPLVAAGLWFYIAAIVILPILALAVTAVQPYMGADIALQTLTLRNFRSAFVNPIVVTSILNTLFLSVTVATICTVVGFLCAYFVVRRPLPGAGVVDVLSILPIGLPAIVLSVGFLWAYLWFPLGIYATIWALVLALVTVIIPHTVRNIDAALRQLGIEPEFAAGLLGAGTTRRLLQIVLPMLKGPLLAGWLFAFLFTAIQVSVPIMLRSPGQEVLSVTVWSLAMDSGKFGEASVVALVQALIAGVIVVIARRVARSRDSAEVSGVQVR
jgi:iron(III) transport system permease protein